MARNTENKHALGAVLQSGRDKMGLTQEKLGELLGLSQRYIVALENEGKRPSFNTLCKLVWTLGVDANAIFFPENCDDDAPAQRISRLLQQCDEHEVNAVAALVETLIKEKAKLR